LATDPTQTPADRIDGEPRPGNNDNPGDLLEKAARCRRLAAGISDRQAADVLRTMAHNYEQSAHVTPGA
jgi:hypothetical protein